MKKNYKKWLQIILLLSIVLVLTACGNVNEPISAESTNLWDRYIIYNLSQFIIWLSNLFGGSYALGIIIFTILIRALLIPLTKMQLKSQREMQALQPELDKIKEKYPNRDRESMQLAQEEQQQLLESHGVNQFAGCLPLLIQLPVMMSLYQSISRTPELKQGHFLWTNLGQMDPLFILPILAAVLTFANSYFTMKSNKNPNSQVKTMMYIMPAFILLISLGLPSAVTLYWVVSNAITLIQTFVYNNPYKIIAEREAKLQAEKEKQRALRKALKRVKK
ncbi:MULTISPECIES: membrane protein insertase YidC [Globicatella]|uniref:Membrane protein insertase YidC n=2 Tax=Globicatella sulfidifaciens TaxID=136093 RepID=A0A1T4JPG9_9LACT|nr:MULTISPECIES: membrane protein insertase YidC [Globicatella]MDT2768416.1 membrane protein insertase YidC [Globicatella sulfidifaciens]NLJ18803.1 membrane protein insertase YidC [Globicatella sulfidifaciens]WPC09550.1 membrane protein insertase YidC [Globicatella sp. PHS-GS-PNBC-21-1553]SJZ31945.1 YidC/Oxa1 family membrane protein insertase [Globicatella sulfidifaciens DSM 15739]